MSAHRRDEYLQAARVAIEPDRVQIQLDLTSGIAVADKVLPQIDSDRTGTISPAEARAYAEVVLDALSLQADGNPVRLELRKHRFPAVESIRAGEEAIRLELTASMPPLAVGSHSLRYRNMHRPDIGVYLANALIPASDRVAISAQRRDVDQRELTIDFVLRADPSTGANNRTLAIAVAMLAACAVLGYVPLRRKLSMR